MKTSWKENIQRILFGEEPNAKRRRYLDYLRVMAVVFVIGVHTVSLASSLLGRESGSAFLILEIFNFMFLSCNLLFIMISGALLLPVKKEKAVVFFSKRFTKVAVPLVIYYVLYVCAKEGVEWLYPDHWVLMIKRILSGAPQEAPHFWLVYSILFLYVLTPFFRSILQGIPNRVLKGLLVVLLLVNAVCTYAPFLGVSVYLSVIMDSFACVFILGYFLSGKSGRTEENFLIVAGFISFVISCILIVKTQDYATYLYNNAPTMVLFSAMLFLLVKRGEDRKEYSAGGQLPECRIWNLFVRMIAKYSFSILLIHWGVMHFAVKQVLGINVLGAGIIGGCLLMLLLTLLISVIGAILIDNTLIRLLTALFSKIGAALRHVFSSR